MSDQNTIASFFYISYLQKSEIVLVNQDNDIAEIFLQIFFLLLPEYTMPKKLDMHKYHYLLMYEVIEEEVQKAIFTVISFIATGINGVPTIV